MRRLLFALAVAAMAACTYDWKVGPSGGAADSGNADAAATIDGATTDGSSADGPTGDCDTLKAQIGIAYAKILACSSTCADSVQSECGCTLAVEGAQSAGAKEYTAAVTAFKNAGCPPQCSPCNAVLHQCFQQSGTGTCI